MNRLAARLALVLPCLWAAPAAAQDAAAQTFDPAWAKQFAWRSIGPANMGGRIIDLAVYEKDPSTFWVATASGGLLKTTNNGVTFEHQFDKETTVSLGAVAVAPSDQNIVWVGTGEYSPRNSVSYGDGVYKSADGGKTWKHMGLKETFQTGDIVIHPEDPDIVYVGALGRLYGPNEDRGLYRTNDGGETWDRILFVDDKTGVIDIAMHPTDPDKLLVATYERQRDGFDTNDPAKKIAPGSGLYRTTDGGKSFDKVTKGLPTCDLGRIGLDWFRGDPDVVFAIVESHKIGMWGDDVGWAGLDTEDAETGAKVTRLYDGFPAAEAGLKVGDIVLSVDGTTVLKKVQLDEQLAKNGVGDSVKLEVARGDEGKELELTLVARPDEEPGQEAAEEGEGAGRRGGRGRRGFGGSNWERPFGERLGGQVANRHRLQGRKGYEHGGVYRSDDGGKSWRRINSINPRPMYFSSLHVDPSDDQHLYVLGISMARSKDGGETFTPDAGRGVHADHHAMWIDPNDGRHMMVGCDGGVYVTYDRCENWQHLNHAALGQFYHVAVGPRRDYWVYGGLQDNGSWGAPHRAVRGSGTVNEDWLRVGGGDGFVCRVDANDPDQIYYESQNGGMGRTHLATMEQGRIRPRAPEGTSYRFNWQTPFILSHHNSRIYYCAGNHVFRSLDRGDDLKQISPEITRGERGSATALAESPRDPDVLYVGTDDGALWGTKDGGNEWKDLWVIEAGVGAAEASANGGGEKPPAPAGETAASGATATATRRGDSLDELVPGPRWVSSIEPSRYVTGRVYITLDAHRSDDDSPYVLVSENFGKSWKSLNANLPRGSTRCVREDIQNPNVLYLGTEFGLYVSADRGDSWTRFHGDALPTVAIHEVAQHAASGEIVLATHGRSLWVCDVTPLRQMKKQALEADAFLFDPNDVVTWRTRHRRGSSGGASRFEGDNPPTRAEIFYRLADDAGSVSLEIQDPAGKTLREIEIAEASTKAGLHRVTWGLDRPMTEAEMAELRQRFGARFSRFRGRFGGRGGGRGRTVSPGTYNVVLKVDGETFSQSFEVQPDPNFPAGSAPASPFGELEELEELEGADGYDGRDAVEARDGTGR